MTPEDQRAHRAVALAGATGLVGRACLQRLFDQATIGSILALGRHAPDLQHPKLHNQIVDFTAPDEITPSTGPIDAALCALGTTIKKAGSQQAFRAVDHDAVTTFAVWAKRQGCPTFVLISSVGANPKSKNFYLRTKGETEQSVAALGFARLVILRPGLLLGKRKESRPGETLAQIAVPFFNPLLPGKLRRYRGIPADAVAAAMVAAAETQLAGVQICHNDELWRLAHA